MGTAFIHTLWRAAIGRFGTDDAEGFKKEFTDQILGNLKSGEFVIRYDQLHIWVNNPIYEETLEESKQYLLDKLITQGGSARRFAERLISSNGICLHIGKPEKGRGAKLIKSDNLATACKIWYALDKEVIKPTNLVLRIGENRYTLIHGKRYTLGRGGESGNMSEMITIPDSTRSISRNQAEIFYERGAWFCKAMSTDCSTYIQRPEGNLVYPYTAVALKDNYPNENTIEFINDGTSVSLTYRFEYK